MKVPHNMKTMRDRETLRDLAEDQDEMKKGIEYLKQQLSEEKDDLKRAALMSHLGVYCRILNDYANSEEFFIKAIELYREKDHEARAFAVRLRLAHTYHWKEQYTKSDEIFLKSLEKIKKSSDKNITKYKDYILQHFGKSKFDRQMYKDALNMFLEALELRLAKGDLDLIESTQMAIDRVREFVEKE